MKLLNQAQAKAVYDAMVSMNNVGGRIAVSLEEGRKEVCEWQDGAIFIHADFGFKKEEYANQNEFATAYNLN